MLALKYSSELAKPRVREEKGSGGVLGGLTPAGAVRFLPGLALGLSVISYLVLWDHFFLRL